MKTESKKRREAQEDMMTKTDPTLLSNTTFALIPELHPSTKRAIVEHMGLKTMTEIQSKAFHPIFSGSDVVGQARTGTGKTLAYLVPALQRLFYLQSMNLFRPNRDVGVVILSPVRELAVQIAEQVEDLLRFHDPPTSISSSSSHPRISVQVLSGSTSVGRDVAEMNQRIPSIISATPGRLLEHLQNTRVHARHFGKDIMKHTKILIIDEADRLLDMGFHEDLSSILSYLPRKENRQTLMFSATMSQSLRRAIPPMIREESFVSIDCVGHGETNVQVKQSHIVLPTVDDYVHSLIHILHHTMEKNKTSYKIIVFFPTARLVSYFAKLFQVVFGTTVLELHSKKSLGHRHRVHDLFYASKNGILCTSDVSSRGIDYPDVTLVLQVRGSLG
jgi:ATP-dependent RNA helicase MSS116